MWWRNKKWREVPVGSESGAEEVSILFQEKFVRCHSRVNDPQNALLPSIPDSVVMTVIWPRLPLSASVLWQLQRVSRRWRRFVGRTLEWEALEVVRIDNRGYKAAVRRGLPRASLNERLSFEHCFLQFCLVMGDGVACPSHFVFLAPGVFNLDDE